VEEESGAAVRQQKDLEDEFFDFFGELVSEWNPCFSVDGCDVRDLWDREVGAYDVSVPADVVTRGEGVEVELGSKCPQRVRLRSLLDGILESGWRGEALNLEPLKRLVCFLVHKSGRHDEHGMHSNTTAVSKAPDSGPRPSTPTRESHPTKNSSERAEGISTQAPPPRPHPVSPHPPAPTHHTPPLPDPTNLAHRSHPR
jgi:hypothetical protein